MNGPTTYEVEAEVPKKYGGKWVVINPSLADMDEARAIQKRLKRDSGLPIRVVRVETTRTVEANPLDTENRPVTIPDQGAGQFAVASETEGGK